MWRLSYAVGMLVVFFLTLYDEDVISEDAFIQWEQSEDLAEQNGRDAARISVLQFFTWLKEAEEEMADN